MDVGIDPAEFSWRLCRYMAGLAVDLGWLDDGRLSPRRLLEEGYDYLCRDRNIIAGGSTACVAVAQQTGIVEVAKWVFLHCAE